MDKTYTPKTIEDKWLQRWLEADVFHSDASAPGDPYCIVIPPPNVTGILHMGHALNNTIQDILVRWRRMQGRNVVWMPGTDHAGIATQNVVERALRKEGVSRTDLGREAFVERVWQWREQYGNTIINQLKRLGASCDWQRERFTMDEGLSDAVAEVFVRLYNKGLIYRASYIINWCPRCHTALSDEESEHQETQGKLYYLRYPVKSASGDGFVVVATTRPETMLGDVAIAVNPADPRYLNLEQAVITLPVVGRVLKVIRDDLVDPQFGTGAVKVTPAHDPNDFAMAQRHGLESVNVMNGDATMNELAGPYAGLDRMECRRRLVADLEAQGLVEKIVPHTHAVGHCYRCDTVVEPRLSPQWFVRMKPLAGPAIEAVTGGQVRFVPDRWSKVYLEWMENIRDWCISRQIWWGHRIPIFTCQDCGHEWAQKGQPTVCPKCGSSDLQQDPDVLDTWFSSWLWPFSTFGWPASNPDLACYYPTHDLVTASEIIFFWVARMIMAGGEFMGQPPFRCVYIHGTVRDDLGRKMSKSLGNSIDPLTVIDQYSADALRFSLMMITATGQDVFLANDKFEIGRNFGTKLWNAARFIQMNSEGCEEALNLRTAVRNPNLDPALLSPDDKHLLLRLQDAIRDCTQNLEKYRFNDVAHGLYEFVWHQFCDWYVEYAKDILNGEDPVRRLQVLRIMHHVFGQALLLLQPLMPFLTEELWHAMGYCGESDFILRERWPELLSEAELERLGIRREEADFVDQKRDLVRAGRTLRAEYNVPPSSPATFRIKPNSEALAGRLVADLSSLRTLLRAGEILVDPVAEPGGMPSALCAIGTVYLSLQGLVDLEAEIRKLEAQAAKVDSDLARVAQKLNDPGFVGKAPAEVVEGQRQRQREWQEKKEKLLRLAETLRSYRG